MGSGFAARGLRRAAGLAAGAGLGIAAAAAGTTAAAADIAPHRAFYAVELVRAAPSSGLEALSGAVVFELSSGCGREVVNRETRLLMRRARGGETAVRVDFSAWESLDGAAYGFSGKTSRSGVVVEERRGAASLAAPGGKGEAVYSKPGKQRMALPAGTLFPGAWIRDVLSHARSGSGVMTRPVFFGEDEDGLMTASLLILPDSAADGEHRLPEALDGIASWRAQTAFFSPEGGSTPVFETTERFFENGVGGDATIAFPDFTLRYRLKDLALLAPPDC